MIAHGVLVKEIKWMGQLCLLHKLSGNEGKFWCCIWGFSKLQIVIFRWLVRGSRGQRIYHNMKFTTIIGEGKYNISYGIKRKDIETKSILVH